MNVINRYTWYLVSTEPYLDGYGAILEKGIDAFFRNGNVTLLVISTFINQEPVSVI